MREPNTFSYIVIDRKTVDTNGKPMVSLYAIWIKDPEVLVPAQTFQSTVPSITVKIYRGNPYPWFNYSEAVETRVKQDISQDAQYAALVMAQTHGKEWHLVSQTLPEN
jgi:hypothetical protein